jgi:hypothetical protein
VRAARRRLGICYDTGFDLHSPRQFCSRFSHEVIGEATGEALGQVRTFAEIFDERRAAPLWGPGKYNRCAAGIRCATTAIGHVAWHPCGNGGALFLVAHWGRVREDRTLASAASRVDPTE